MKRENLKLSEQGSKCPKHEVFYQTEWHDSCCKTVQFCPKCREEQYDPLKLFYTYKGSSPAPVSPSCG